MHILIYSLLVLYIFAFILVTNTCKISTPGHGMSTTWYWWKIVVGCIDQPRGFWSLAWKPHKRTLWWEISQLSQLYARLTAANTELRPYILSALYCDNSLEMASQIAIVCSTVCSSADQRKHHSSASLAFEMGIHRWPVNSRDKGPVIRKMFPLDDVIMETRIQLKSPANPFVSYFSVFKSFRNSMRSMSITDVFYENF